MIEDEPCLTKSKLDLNLINRKDKIKMASLAPHPLAFAIKEGVLRSIFDSPRFHIVRFSTSSNRP